MEKNRGNRRRHSGEVILARTRKKKREVLEPKGGGDEPLLRKKRHLFIILGQKRGLVLGRKTSGNGRLITPLRYEREPKLTAYSV